jgi:outer membrane protein insertion porin family
MTCCASFVRGAFTRSRHVGYCLAQQPRGDWRSCLARIAGRLACLLVGLALATPAAWAQGGPEGTPAFVDPNFRDRVWESGGPRLSQIDTGKLVAAVEIVGNKSVSQHKILSHMQTRPDRIYDEKQLQADIHELYRTELFRKVTPSIKDTPDGVVIRLEIIEQPLVDEVIFHGNTRLDDRTLKKHCGIEKGDPANPFSVEMARQRLVDLYREKGMNHADVQVREGAKPGERRVFFEIAEGNVERIWSIEFVGNAVFNTALLKTKIQSRDALNGVRAYLFNIANISKIQSDEERLTAYYRSLGYFQARVKHRIEYDTSGTWMNVTFVIDEGPQFQIRNIHIAGNQYFTEQQLATGLTLKPGEPFNLGKMSRDQRTLRSDYYGREGFVFVDISPEPHFIADEPAKMDLVYRITEGDRYKAGQIRVHIDGDSSHTKHSVVINRIGLREGRIIDLRELEASERRLRASQIFESNPALAEPPRIEILSPDERAEAESLMR